MVRRKDSGSALASPNLLGPVTLAHATFTAPSSCGQELSDLYVICTRVVYVTGTGIQHVKYYLYVLQYTQLP